jgi:hypothetical protein
MREMMIPKEQSH